MGYTTTFKGSIKIEPPLSASDVIKIDAFLNKTHDGYKFPSYRCDFKCNRFEIEWNGCEKSYEMGQWLAFLITEFFRPMKRKLNGQMEAQGEDFDDRWLLKVEDNFVSIKHGKTVYE